MAIFGMTHSALSAKQASLLGCGVTKGFQDYFGDGGTANAVKSIYWTEVTNGVSPGTVTIQNGTDDLPVYCEIASGADADDYARIHTDNKYILSPYESDVSAIHLRTKARFSSAAGDARIGLDEGFNPEDHTAMIYFGATSILYWTEDSGNSQAVDASGDLDINTWYVFEIVWNTTAVKFYVDDDLKQTHTTRVPAEPLYVDCASRNFGGAANTLDVQYIQVWGE